MTATKRKRADESDEIRKLNDIEHALHAGDFYIGQSIHTESETIERFVYDVNTQKMVYKSVKYPKGLLKIFDEMLVNAADACKRQVNPCTRIDVHIGTKSTQHMSVTSYGGSFKIRKTEHASRWNPKQKAYQPELAFFHCKTSSAYSKKARTTGGKYGLGAKLVSIFSTESQLVMYDGTTYYEQVSRNNMKNLTKPTVRPSSRKPELQLSCAPDFALFYPKGKNPDNFEPDLLALMITRVVDIAGITKRVKVNLIVDGRHMKLPARGFKNYLKLFIPASELEEKNDAKLKVGYFENERWEVCIIKNPYTRPMHVSFVNSINTHEGGHHVRYIERQIIRYCEKKIKGIKAHIVRRAVMVFINATIVNPDFSSQSKESLRTVASAFGSTCVLPESRCLNVIKSSGALEAIKLTMDASNIVKARRDIGAKKTSYVGGIKHFQDAAWAGTRKSIQCSLMLVEGVSALQLAKVGIATMGPDKYGALALRGVGINADTHINRLQKNKEFMTICRVLGLQIGRKAVRSSLRYGRIILFSDSDVDGSHIKGLLLYLLCKMWPELLEIPNFIGSFITPIVVVTKGRKSIPFYTMFEYETWDRTTPDSSKWKAKHLKGLGSSDNRAGERYFNQFDKLFVKFKPTTREDIDSLEMAFNKGQASRRKEWIQQYDATSMVPYGSIQELSVSDFINNDMIHFSWASIKRGIPNAVDGFTPAKRKAVYTFMRKNITDEMKVSEAQSVVSLFTNYHHNSDSLATTIVGLAQSCISNNMNFFAPKGQFGNRCDYATKPGGPGSSVASSRYIFTHLLPITKHAMGNLDILEEHIDEGRIVEPHNLAPIIPIILINGARNISTAYSCRISGHKPEDLVQCIFDEMDGKDWDMPEPWYHKFKGQFTTYTPQGAFVSNGVWKEVPSDANGYKLIVITELPVYKSSNKQKDQLHKLKELGNIEYFNEYHKAGNILYKVYLNNEQYKRARGDFTKFFNLTSSFDDQLNLVVREGGKDHIRSFATLKDIFKYFYNYRLKMSEKERQYYINDLQTAMDLVANKIKFIRLTKTEITLNRDVVTVHAQCLKHGLRFIDQLLQMKISSLSSTHVERLEREQNKLNIQLSYYQNKTAKQYWRDLLVKFVGMLPEYWETRMKDDGDNR